MRKDSLNAERGQTKTVVENKNQNTNAVYSDLGGVQAPPSVGFASDSLSDPQALSLTPTPYETIPNPADQKKAKFITVKRAGIAVAAVVLLVGLGWVLVSATRKNQTPIANSVASNYDTLEIPLTSFSLSGGVAALQAQLVSINGTLEVNDGLVVSPSVQPANAQPGQIYFDQDSKQLAYHNGTGFIALPGTTQNVNVESLGGLTGQVAVGAGLTAVGGQLTNSGVLTVQGQSGNVSLSAGTGIAINGTTITNAGIVSVTSGSPSLTVTNDGNGNITLTGSGAGTVSSPGGTSGRLVKFTGAQTVGDSLISESGITVTVTGDLSVVTGGLSLSNALTVSNGGTGATSLALNGVIVGQGTGALTSVTSGGPGLCLMSTAGAPNFAACPGGGGVTSLNGLTGAISIANASGAGATVTIDDATTSSKGITSFNSTNFTVSGGIANTIQNINTTATPTFAGVNTNNITPGAALTVGISAQTALLQGSTTTITSAGVGNDIVLNSADTIELLDNTNVTGNLVASGDLAANGGDITSTGALNVTPGGALTVGASAQSLTLQGNGSTTFRATDSGNTTIIGFTSPTANTTLNFPALSAGTYTICTSGGGCSGATTTLQNAYDNSTTPEIVLDATRGAITIRDNAAPLGTNLLEVQSNGGGSTYLAVTSSGIAVTGTAAVTGNINSSAGAIQTGGTTRLDNGGNLSNIAALTLSGAISGGTTVTGSGNFNTTTGSLQTAGTTRVDNSGNLTNIAALTLSGAISGGTSVTGSGNFNTTGGVIQTNSTTRIDNSGNLVNIGSLTASGSATLQGGSVTLGTTSQAGSLVINDGSSNTGTLQVAALAQDTIFTIPDPGVGTATICLSTGNCAGSGGGVTGSGTNNRITKFTSTGSTVGDSTISDDGTNVTTTVDMIIQGGDVTLGTTGQLGSLVMHDGNGQTTTLRAGDSSGNLVFIFPTNAGGTNQCLKQSGTGNQLIWDSCDGGGGGSSGTLQTAYANGNSIATSDARDIDITLANTTTDSNLDIVVADDSTGFVSLTRVNGTGTNDPAQLMILDNLDTDRAVPVAIRIQSAAGGISTGIDASDVELGDALSVGANNIVGTTGNIDFANFDLVGATGNLSLAGSISGGTTYSGSGNINTSGGAIQTNGTSRIDNSGNLVNIVSLTASGNATLQGGTVTLGTNAQAGSIIINDGSSNTGTIQTASLGQNTVFTIPDPGVGTADICLSTGNCAGAGGGVTGSGTNNTIVKFTSTGSTVGNSSITDDGVTVAVGVAMNVSGNTVLSGDLAVNGNDITSTGALVLTSGGAGNITLNAAGSIQLQDNTTVSGNLLVDGTAADALTVQSSANGSGIVVLNVQQSDGDSVLRVTDLGTLAVGNATNVAGTVAIGNGAIGFFGEIKSTNLSAARTYELPNVSGTLCTDAGNCGSATGTLQAAYTFSAGGTTPEIKLDGTRTGLDIQDADTTLGAGSNFISFRAPNAGGLGSILYGVGMQGNLFMQPSTDRTDLIDVNTNGGANLFVVDSSNSRVGIAQGGTTLPSYTLDVGGDINTSGVYRVGGTQISSANLSNDANLAKLNASQTFTGNSNAFRNGTNSTNAFSVQNALGNRILTIDSSNAELELGLASTLDGKIVFSNMSNANTVTIVPGTPGGNRTLTLPDVDGIICTDAGNCNGVGATLQTAYNFSTGGTTPKIKVSSGLGSVDIQDADTTIAANLFNVRASNGSGLGSVMLGVGNTGALTLQNSANSTTAFRLLTQGGSTVITGDTTNGLVVLGQSTTLNGQLVFNNATNSNQITLTTAVAGGPQTITLPNATGTVCLTSGNCAGIGGTGDILQGGNSFTAAMTIGTNDAFDLNLETTGTTRLTVESDGSQVTFASGVDLVLQGSNSYISNRQASVGAAEAFGLNAAVDGNGTAVGNQATAGTGGAFGSPVAVGYQASAASWGTAIGGFAVTTGQEGTALGQSAIAAAQGTALGANASTAAGSNGIAIGFETVTSAANQLVIGSNNFGITHAVLGSGVTDATPSNILIQGTSGSGSNIAGANMTLAAGQSTGSANGGNVAIQISAPGGAGASLNTLATVATFSGANGSLTLQNAVNSATALTVQNAANSDTMFSIDTTARSGSGGNLIKIGNSTGTDGATTILQLDSTTADPSSNLAALNGGMFYNSTTGKVSLIENGAVKVICNTTDLGCGTGTVTLQSAYNNSTNPEITFGSAATAGLTLRDNGTPISGNLFEVQNNGGGTTYFGLTTAAATLGSNVDLTLQGATAYISNAQGQTASESFGNNAAVSGGNAIALGNGATAAADSVAIGQGAVAVASAVAIGQQAGASSGAFGGPVSIGDSANAAAWGVAIGTGSVTGGNWAVAVGEASSAAQNGVAIGEAAVANSAGVAIGGSATTGGNNRIVIGYSSEATADNQLVIGGSNADGSFISNAYIGSGVTDIAPQSVALQATGGSGTNIAGANFTLAGGRSTGSANGGNVAFQISAPGSSGTGLNALSTVGTFSGATGGLTLQNAVNSINAFNVQNAAGTSQVNVSTLTTNTNQMPNGDFETQSTQGWAVRGSADQLLVSTAFARFGTYSLHLRTQSAANNGMEFRAGLKPSTQYSLSLWARRSTGSAAAFNIGRADNGSDTDCLTNQTFNTTWTQFTCTFTTGATVNQSANFYVKQTDTSTDEIYIDGVTLVAGATALTYASPASGLQVEPHYNNLTINAGYSGELQPWQNNQATLNAVRSRAGVTAYNGYVYVLGGGTTIDGQTVATTNTVQYAKLNADGSVGSFTNNTNNLNTNVSGAGAVAMNGYIYLVGGKTANSDSTNNTATVQYAKLNADGSTGTWSTTTALPDTRGDIGVTSYNGYIYTVGGYDNGAGETNTTYYAKVNADGTITSWTAGTTLTNSITTAGSAVVAANGYLYNLGGGGGGTGNPYVSVAKINSNGSLGTWTNSIAGFTPALPDDTVDNGAVVMNGYIYSFGGYNGTTILSSVWYAQLRPDGSTSEWSTSANPMPNARENIDAVTANGYAYIIGGDDNTGTPTRSNIYYTSGPRVKVTGALDLVGNSGESLAEGGSGGELTAGNTNIIGTLKVQEAAQFMRGLSVDGAVAFSAGNDSTGAFAVMNAAGVPQFVIDTSNTRTYIGNPTADGTGALLVLDTKNTTGDPTGVNGAMYYNSATHQFRCYRGVNATAGEGHWQACGINPIDRGWAIEDEFLGGDWDSGEIGELGWTSSDQSGTPSFTYNVGLLPVGNRPGTLEIDTSNGSNAGVTMNLDRDGQGAAVIATGNNVKSTVGLDSTLANSILRVGLHNQRNTNARPLSGVWWEAANSVNARWQFCYGDGATATCSTATNTTPTIAATTWYRLEIRITATGSGTSAAEFFIDGVRYAVSGVTIDTTNRVNPAIACWSSTTASRFCSIDYYQFSGISTAAR
jgi:hypothetical protein